MPTTTKLINNINTAPPYVSSTIINNTLAENFNLRGKEKVVENNSNNESVIIIVLACLLGCTCLSVFGYIGKKHINCDKNKTISNLMKNSAIKRTKHSGFVRNVKQNIKLKMNNSSKNIIQDE